MEKKNQNKKRKKKPDLNETAFNIVKKATKDELNSKQKKTESDNNHK